MELPAPVRATRASLGAGEIVCGVDDGPVPIGRTDRSFQDDLRRERPSAWLSPARIAARDGGVIGGPLLGEMMPDPPLPSVEAARPEVKLQWSVGPRLGVTPAFEKRAHACGELAEATDTGERTFTVQSGPQGGPLAVRDGGTNSSSKLSMCFASSLCLLRTAGEATADGTAQVHLVTAVSAPVFRGRVTLDIGDERRGPTRPNRGRRRQHDTPPPPPRPASSNAYAKQLVDRLQPGAEACVRARPPGQSFVTTVFFSWGKEGKRAFPTSRRVSPLVDAFERCLSAAVDAVITRPPADFNPDNRIPIVASVDVETPASAARVPSPSP